MKFHHGQILCCSLQALWWMTSAITGVAEMRNITRGNKKLSPKELREDALETARRHIHFVHDLCEVLPVDEDIAKKCREFYG